MTMSTMLDPLHPAHNNQPYEKGVGEAATKTMKTKTVMAVGGGRARRQRLRQRGGRCDDDNAASCFAIGGGGTLLRWPHCRCCNGPIAVVALALLPSLWWCCCCCCAGAFAIVAPALSSLLCWCCCCHCAGIVIWSRWRCHIVVLALSPTFLRWALLPLLQCCCCCCAGFFAFVVLAWTSLSRCSLKTIFKWLVYLAANSIVKSNGILFRVNHMSAVMSDLVPLHEWLRIHPERIVLAPQRTTVERMEIGCDRCIPANIKENSHQSNLQCTTRCSIGGPLIARWYLIQKVAESLSSGPSPLSCLTDS